MNKKDPLEKFILENRDLFDDPIHRPDLWERILPQLPGKQKPRVFTLNPTGAIAAGVLLLLTGALAGRMLTKKSLSQQLAILEQTAPDFVEAERYYQGQIRQKTAMLARFPARNPVLYDLQQLDSAIEDLKQEICSAPKSKEEEIIAKLIQAYQIKIEILELVLQKHQDVPSEFQKKNKHETTL